MADYPAKMSLADYEEYQKYEDWQHDSRIDPDIITSPETHEQYWHGTILAWAKQSDDKYADWRSNCLNVLNDLESADTRTWNQGYTEESIADEPIPLDATQLDEQTAQLGVNYPHPICVANQESQTQYVACLNQAMTTTLKQNRFNTMFPDAVYDAGIWSVAVMKTGTDDSIKGPYGQQSKICIDLLDPAKCKFDPKMTRLDWEHMSYFIYDHHMELGDVRKKYGERAYLVPEQSATSMIDTPDRNLHNYLVSPIPQMTTGETTARRLVTVRECWFKDSQLRFEAYTDDENGEQVLRLDENGKVKGRLVPAYPNGRCMIFADRFLVADFANPYAHARAPFIFMRTKPRRNCLVLGDASKMQRLSRKFNDIFRRVHRFGQSEAERPMMAEVTTFDKMRQFFTTNNSSKSILVTQSGKIGSFMRLPPSEIPQFIFPFLSMFENFLDRISGLSSIQRGAIADGSQMSAQSMEALQQFASASLRMRSQYQEDAIIELGYQLAWLIRQNYKENVKFTINNPDGSTLDVDWTKDYITFNSPDNDQERMTVKANEDYIIEIQSGTGSSGSQASLGGLAKQLYDDGAIDQPEYLQAVKWHNWQQITQRMQKQKSDNIFTASAGRAFGTDIRKREAANQKAGAKERQ